VLAERQEPLAGLVDRVTPEFLEPPEFLAFLEPPAFLGCLEFLVDRA
jgi:hypothetical protein